MTSEAPGAQTQKLPTISFEFFPPKTEEMERNLWEVISRLAPLTPNFVSVTYGAGGSTRERTHATITRILSETDLTPAAHLTCVDATRADVDDVVARYYEVGVRHIVALRGDPSNGIGTAYQAHPRGYQTSADLVAAIKRNHSDMEVSVSAYPEKHPESTDLDADIDVLKAKVDAGATRAITQFFFDNDLYFRYLDRVRAAGITIPVVPGSCRCRISSSRATSPSAQARRCRNGWPRNSRAWMTTPIPVAWSRLRWPLNKSRTCRRAASRTSTFIR